ncbi:hypothetical protein PSPL106493_03235 [Pseudomonas plecoglossicida]
MRYVKLAGCNVPAIGQGTWYMGEDPTRRAAEVAALQQGIELGNRRGVRALARTRQDSPLGCFQFRCR